MSKHKLSDVQQCVYNNGKTGAKVGCANLPVFYCQLHGKCIHTKSCRSGSLRACVDCSDFSKTLPTTDSPE